MFDVDSAALAAGVSSSVLTAAVHCMTEALRAQYDVIAHVPDLCMICLYYVHV